MGILASISDFLAAHAGAEGAVLAVLLAIAKRVSNDSAGPIVSKIQGAFDFVAKAASAIGNVAKQVSDLLAKALQSDGFLGKK